jgi:hypothetical protein
MQIAPVSVVFALAAAGALGMAVKDTVGGVKARDPFVYGTSASTDEAEEAEAEWERQRAKEVAEERRALAAEEQARRVLGGTLFGDEVASRGPALGTLEIGMSVERYDVTAGDIDEALQQADFSVDMRGGPDVQELFVSTRSDGGTRCGRMTEELTARWGEPVRLEDDSVQIWWNQKTSDRVRVHVDAYDECDIVFDHASTVEAWFTRAMAVGKAKTLAAIDEAVHVSGVEGLERSDTAVWWTEPGLGKGRGTTSFYVELDGEKVTSVTVTVKSVDGPELAARVRGSLGTEEEVGSLDWKAKRVHLAIVDEDVELTFGHEAAE